MSRVALNHGNVPLFVRSGSFFLHAQFVTLPWCPDINANHPIERNYGNSVRFLAKIPNGTAAESPCYSVFWNAIDFCRLYTSKKNLNVGPAGKSCFFYAKCPSKTFSRLAGLPYPPSLDLNRFCVLGLHQPSVGPMYANSSVQVKVEGLYVDPHLSWNNLVCISARWGIM